MSLAQSRRRRHNSFAASAESIGRGAGFPGGAGDLGRAVEEGAQVEPEGPDDVAVAISSRVALAVGAVVADPGVDERGEVPPQGALCHAVRPFRECAVGWEDDEVAGGRQRVGPVECQERVENRQIAVAQTEGARAPRRGRGKAPIWARLRRGGASVRVVRPKSAHASSGAARRASRSVVPSRITRQNPTSPAANGRVDSCQHSELTSRC